MKSVLDYMVLVLFIMVCCCSGFLSALVANSGPGIWYDALNKPWFTPPSWLFMPVWTLLYALMGVAGYLVYICGLREPKVRGALALFAVQLVANFIWSPLFFRMHRMDLALVDVAVMWCAIAACVAVFWQSSRSAALLMVPYLAWVTFAALLNLAFWQLNR